MTHDLAIWSGAERPQLIASRNAATGELRFPAYRPSSPLASRNETVPVSGPGTIYSCTTIPPYPRSGAQPFVLAYVDLPGPVRVLGRVDGTRIGIGDRCVAEPDESFGYVFRAAGAQGEDHE